jgi:hypothetical protein
VELELPSSLKLAVLEPVEPRVAMRPRVAREEVAVGLLDIPVVALGKVVRGAISRSNGSDPVVHVVSA